MNVSSAEQAVQRVSILSDSTNQAARLEEKPSCPLPTCPAQSNHKAY